MDQKKRDGLERLKESLILAAEDMDQAIAATAALRSDTSGNEGWRRALEAAIAVCYMRPFTKGAWRLPNKYVPTAPAKDVHELLDTFRDKVYAHSDRVSGRSAWMKTVRTSGDVATISYGSSWWPLPASEVPAVQALCHDQRERFLTDAAAIQVELENAT
jgi:hypothetical protein